MLQIKIKSLFWWTLQVQLLSTVFNSHRPLQWGTSIALQRVICPGTPWPLHLIPKCLCMANGWHSTQTSSPAFSSRAQAWCSTVVLVHLEEDSVILYVPQYAGTIGTSFFRSMKYGKFFLMSWWGLKVSLVLKIPNSAGRIRPTSFNSCAEYSTLCIL